MSIVRFLSFFTGVAGLLLAVSSSSASEKTRFVTEVFFPYHYTDNQDVQQGYVVDIINEIKKDAGIESEIEFLPWTRAYKLTEKIPNIFLFSMMRTNKREDLFEWIRPVAIIPRAAFFSAAAENMPDYPSIEGYKAHRVCAQEGTPAYQALLNHGFETGKNLFPLLDVAFSSMVLDNTLGPIDHDWYNVMTSGHCQYRISVPVTMWARVALVDSDDMEIVQHIDIPSEHIKDNRLYLATNPDTDPDLVKRVSKSYENLLGKGRLQELCLEKMSWYTVTCDVFDPQEALAGK